MAEVNSVAELLAFGTVQLSCLGSVDSKTEAERLLSHITGRSRTQLFAFSERPVPVDESLEYRLAIKRRQRGEPLAYITGQREFWSLPLAVTPATLIPRPETEVLVEQALKRIPVDVEWRIVDLGTGSGAIALALASERRKCRLIATDRSLPALAIAAQNAQQLGLSGVTFVYADWLTAQASESLNMVVSNPPYIRENDSHLRQNGLDSEPQTALTAGVDGLDCLRIIAEQSRNCLKPGGYLMMEHGYDQADACTALMLGFGYKKVEDVQDYAGQPRVIVGQKS